jgi:hypothetical protein
MNKVREYIYGPIVCNSKYMVSVAVAVAGGGSAASATPDVISVRTN